MAARTVAVWTVLLGLLGQQTACFNLDDDLPIFFTGGNEPDSLFGFSLAPYSFSDNHTSVLVGAPNERGADDTRTGAVYSCELWSGDACRRVEAFDSYRDQVTEVFPGFEEFSTHDNSTILVDGQLLGFSIDSVNNFAVACAPHYSLVALRFNTEGDPVDVPENNGRCVILQRQNTSLPYLQFPFINIFGPQSTSLRSFGTSVKFVSADNGTNLYSSSPLSGSQEHPFGRLYELMVDPVSTTITDNTLSDEVGINGFLGFHVEVGYITVARSSSANPQVIASAPRDQLHRGRVTVWTDVYQGYVTSVVGEETDGYFGYDFAVLPQAADEYDDLVVGCPLCREEQGMAYYYHNNDGVLASIPVQITAPSSQKGRFGISVKNIGDLDRDGYYDVAIAAPLEVGQNDGTDYTGVVYIFRGTSVSIATSYSQVVYGRSSIPLFGYSISSGADLDENSYPDLLIGGVSSTANSQVMFLRGAPVVTVEAEMDTPRDPLVLNNISVENMCRIGEITVVCFTVQLCFNYSILPGDSVEQFKISYALRSDSRVFTNSSDINSDSSSIVDPHFTITGAGTRECRNHTIYLQPNLAQLEDLVFQLNIADSADPLSLPDGLHPVLNVGGRTEWSQTVQLNSTCGRDGICEPELKLTVDYSGTIPVYLSEVFNIPFTITVRNNGVEDGFAASVLITLPLKGIAKLYEIEHQEDSLQSSCVPSSTSSLIIVCPIKSPLIVNETISFDLVLVPIVDIIPLNTTELPFQFQLIDEQNADTDISNNNYSLVRDAVQSVARYATTISTRGDDPLVALPLSSMLNHLTPLTQIPTDPRELGPYSPVEIVVRNDDTSGINSPISSSELLIFWPSQTTIQPGTRLPFLLPLQLLVPPLENTLCTHYNLIPPSLPIEQFVNISFPESRNPPPTNLYPSDCPPSTCGVIVCEASVLAPNTSVSILINSVLYSPAVTANQVVNISVYVRNKGDYPVVENDTTKFALRIQTAVQEVAEDCVNVFVPIVAAIGGFVVLAIIAVLLGFLGFFTRQSRFQRILEERRKVHTFDDDESYAPRIVVPDNEFRDGEPQLLSFARPPSCDASIRDEGDISNGKVSPIANGYNPPYSNTPIELNERTNHLRAASPPAGLEYTDSDILTTSSIRSDRRSPYNLEPRETSPTISIHSKETEL